MTMPSKSANNGYNAPVTKFYQRPVWTQCPCCDQAITSSVEGRIQGGWKVSVTLVFPIFYSHVMQVFAVCCCCCGLMLASLLLVLPGLREFTHYCPGCGARLGQGRPRLSARDLAIIGGVLLLQLKLTTIFVLCVRNYYFR